jgi:hypothetical protein
LGRFIQADTIVPGAGDSKSYDRYTYVNNNPVNYTDPSGYCYIDQYPGGSLGKRGSAELINGANPDPSSATALVCMSAASEACMLAIQQRRELGYKTTHVVLIGPTWELGKPGEDGSRIGFSAWADLVTDTLLDGINILVIYDGSVYDIYPSPEEFTVSGDNVGTYTRGNVPVNDYDKYGYYSILPHHNGWGRVSNFGANNSPELAASVYSWINTGVWNWP